MSELIHTLIGEIRSLQARATALEERLRTVYDRCESAAATIPDCVALGPRGGCLITPWHALGAAHYAHGVGATIRYRWGERRVDGSEPVPGTDIQVYRFDMPAPDGVEPARCLPYDWQRHMPVDRWGRHLRRRIRALTLKAGGSVHETSVASLGEDYGAAADMIQTGDSGQPVWLPLPQPVLIGCWYTRGKGPSVAYYEEAIRRITAREMPAAMLEAEW